MKKTTVIKGIVIIIGAIVSFLFMKFLSGWVVAISIIAICALIFGSIVGGAIGLISILILNISQVFSLWTQGFSLWTIASILSLVSILSYGFYGFILGKIFETKIKNKNLKFGIFILSAMLLCFVINILFWIINYFLNSDIYPIKNILFSSLPVGIIVLITIIIYHKVFKGKIPFFEKDELTEESKSKFYKNIIGADALFYKNIVGAGAILLCLLFFILPLVQGTFEGGWFFSSTEGLTATGWQIATGTGELFDRTDDSAYQVIFFLLIVPIVLLILAFAKRSFIVLGITSAVGLLFKIIFYIVVESTGHDGGFTATASSWIVTALYIGLCAFTFYNWAKLEKNSGNLIVQKAEMTKKCPFCANDIKQEAIVCQFCGRDLPNGGNNS
jgi:hypothetical protein